LLIFQGGIATPSVVTMMWLANPIIPIYSHFFDGRPLSAVTGGAAKQ
jgi:hypothetical protein